MFECFLEEQLYDSSFKVVYLRGKIMTGKNEYHTGKHASQQHTGRLRFLLFLKMLNRIAFSKRVRRNGC